MQTAELDDLWNRLEPIRFRFRDGVAFHQHKYRCQVWYLLEDRIAGRQYRFNESLHGLLARLDGRLTLGEVWGRHANGMQQREELLGILTQLQDAELLLSDRPTSTETLRNRWTRQCRQRARARWMRPLAPRFPLFDPDAFLGFTLPLVRPLFTLPFSVIWLLLVLSGVLAAGMHFDALFEFGASRFSDPGNLLLLWLIYPLVKSLHELGHGYATKIWGGHVHEMGIMLLVLVPIPYVDASAAGAFPEKHRRVIVGAAGIMVESALAAIAIFAWVHLTPGLYKDLAYDVFVVAGVSTLLFNGNPLLRFDGYYVLADAVEIPNLATRSTRYYGYLIKRYLFGLRAALSPVTAAGERAWFLFYGLAAMVYRLFISLTIAFYLAGTYLLLGAVLAVWALTVQFVYPMVRGLGFVAFSSSLRGRRIRAVTVIAALVSAVAGALHFMAAPQGTWAEGVIRPAEASIVRAEAEGFVAAVSGRHGSRVEPGQSLLLLENEQLDTRIAVLRGKLKEIQANLDAERLGDRVQVDIFRERRAKLQGELAQAVAEQGNLTVISPGRGILELPGAKDMLGRFVKKGQILGYVASESDVTARIVVPQSSIERMLADSDAISVHLPGSGGQTLAARALEAVPSATIDLPSSVLGSRAGGAIAVDVRDERGLRAMERVFQFDITLSYQEALRFVGRRVYVRLEHQDEALAPRLYRYIRRLFLSQLET